MQTLLEENDALARRAAELESAQGAASAQLEVAAADNVRLAREAAAAARELQTVAAAAGAGRGREQQLLVRRMTTPSAWQLGLLPACSAQSDFSNCGLLQHGT